MPSNRSLYVDPCPMPTNNESLTSLVSRKFDILTTSSTHTQNVTPVISSWASFFHGAQSTCFFDFCKGTFIHYDLETKERTGFDRNDFQKIQGETVWSNLIIVSTNSIETKFLAAIREEATGKLYIVLFNANFSQHKISVVSEMWSNFESKRDYRFYLYKSGNGQIFMIAFWRNNVQKITRYCVRKVCVTEMGLVFGRASSCKYLGLWFLPFVEDDILYFLPANKKNKILKISLNGDCKTEIPINCDDNQISTLGEAVGSPLNFGGRIIFCWVTGDKKVSVLWSLQLEKLLLKCEGHFPADEFSLLQYAIATPDGSVFVVAERKILHVALPQYWIKDRTIDRGGYGVVMTAAYATHGNIAVKILMVSMKNNEYINAVSEAERINKLNNPFIVTAFGYIAEEVRLLLFMELMDQSVRNKILCTPEKRLKEKDALGIMQQALKGLVYLHLLKPRAIVHRDIKCDNLLIDKEGNVKLADFGLAKDVILNSNASSDARNSSNKIVGTPYFKAPEILVSNSNSCSRKVDVWSIGCALAEMLTGLPPYADIHRDTHSWAILAYNEKLTYKPEEFLPREIIATAKISLKILKKTFIRQTKRKSLQQLSSRFVQGNTGERIRPHSWELLEEFWK